MKQNEDAAPSILGDVWRDAMLSPLAAITERFSGRSPIRASQSRLNA